MFGDRLVQNARCVGADDAVRGGFRRSRAVVPDAKSSDHTARREGIVEGTAVRPMTNDHVARAARGDCGGECVLVRRRRPALERCTRPAKYGVGLAKLRLGHQDDRRDRLSIGHGRHCRTSRCSAVYCRAIRKYRRPWRAGVNNMARVQTSATIHDVVIIGSGAGGGTVTKVLADLGVKVLLMEAGPMVSMGDFKMLQPPSSVWHRGAGEHGAALHRRPGDAAQLQRRLRRQHRRRALHRRRRAAASAGSARGASAAAPTTTARVQLRYADYDFKPHDYDGLGWNWPITYAGHRALLRQGRAPDRRDRQGRRAPQRAGRHLPGAGAAQAARDPASRRPARSWGSGPSTPARR